MLKENIGHRGKTAEKEVELALKQLNMSELFAYFRMPDARAAMGRLSASPADFIYFSGDRSGFIEVKSTKHNFRLSRASFSQLPALHKFGYAGASNILLVHHSDLEVWRVIPPEALETDVTSWNLIAYKPWSTAAQALLSTGYFI
jgi:hypothetical protein